MHNEVTVQTSMFGILDQSINRVFKAVDVTNKAGEVIGVSIKPMKRSEVAGANGLKTGRNDKDKLDAIELQASDGLLSVIKSKVGSLNGEWTAKTSRVWTDKNGDMNMSFRLKTAKRSMSDDKLARAMFPEVQYPAMTLEEKIAAVVSMRASQESQLASNLLKA